MKKQSDETLNDQETGSESIQPILAAIRIWTHIMKSCTQLKNHAKVHTPD